MSIESERERLQALTDRLRGLDPSQLEKASRQVGKMQEVKEVGAPTASLRLEQSQAEPSARHRHVLDNKQRELVGSPPTATATPEQQKIPPERKEQEKTQAGKQLAEAARRLRENGATMSRADNDTPAQKQTPAVEKRQSRGLER